MTRTSRPGGRGLLAVAAGAAAMWLAACGGTGTASPSTSASASASASATAVPATQVPPTPTPTPTPQSVTASQSIAVAKALFPLANGQYGECDQGVDNITGCPFDSKLRQQILTYSANYHRLCPSGCGGALLLLRQQCGGFTNEDVSTPQNPAISIVRLTGNSCLGVGETMYVSVIIENGVPVADDVYCNVGDPKYGMYDPSPDATGGKPCAPAS